MGKRRDRGIGISSYLTRHTGIPLVEWGNNAINAPAPYEFTLVSGADYKRWHDAVPMVQDTARFPISFLYGPRTEGSVNAMACMRLGQAADLLKLHAELISRDRPFGRS